MKKTLLIIASVCMFMLFSCGEKQKTYTYVEPKENIAYKIWSLLIQENQEVKPVVEAAIEFDYYTQEEATDTINKTELKYDYIIPQGFAEEDNSLAANYHLKCFQKLDGTWVGMVIKDVHGYGLDEADCGKKLFAVHYDGTKTTGLDINQLFPEWFGFIQDYYAESYDNCFYFSNESMFFTTSGYWPVKLNWNGNGFEKDPESVLMTNSVQMAFGDFIYYDKGRYTSIAIGEEYAGGTEVKNSEGHVLAHLDIKDGIVEGYTLESPTCGVAQDFDYDSELGVSKITSKPIALGYPIQNVLDYEKGYWMKDTVVSQGMKDGKYVITQQIAHDKLFKKRDVFIDYTAKDEHSNIEQIRVYSVPIAITMENEVNESETLQPLVKEIFNALGYDFRSPEFGDFDHFIACSDDKNGFDFYFNGEVKNVRFQTYDAGEKNLVILAKYGEDEKLMDINSWYYQDGVFKETIVDLPVPVPEEFEAYTRNDDYDIKPENYILSFNDKGIEYYAITERNDGASTKDEDGIYINPDFYTIKYQWNGNKFE
ncbi:MAG: hypothetical protein IKT08_09280 [Bacteroidales bacterium]|nr:hypothetical protein [Bacteroidales bacterium]